MTSFPALIQKNVHSHDKDENKFQRIPSHLVPNSKSFLLQSVEMYILQSFYLACFCGLFYSKARVRTRHREFLPGA